MPNRESQIQTFLQEWKGMDQRTSPVRVQEGFFSNTNGTYFGLGENAERVPGKLIAGQIKNDMIVNLHYFDQQVLIQGINGLYILPYADLLARNIVPTQYDRITQDGNIRITEDGNTRIIA